MGSLPRVLPAQNVVDHLWHTGRTASAHSIENRVPFPDRGLVERIRRVAVRLRAELFTDKAILWRAAPGLVPPEIAARTKGHSFYGRDQRNAIAMAYSLRTANRGALIKWPVDMVVLADMVDRNAPASLRRSGLPVQEIVQDSIDALARLAPPGDAPHPAPITALVTASVAVPGASEVAFVQPIRKVNAGSGA